VVGAARERLQPGNWWRVGIILVSHVHQFLWAQREALRHHPGPPLSLFERAAAEALAHLLYGINESVDSSS